MSIIMKSRMGVLYNKAIAVFRIFTYPSEIKFGWEMSTKLARLAANVLTRLCVDLFE